MTMFRKKLFQWSKVTQKKSSCTKFQSEIPDTLYSTFSERKKVHVGFCALILSILEIHHYIGKFGFNIFPDLKSRQKINDEKYLKN
jgi:hypothetical protein